jgi:hypothetical protein
LVLLIFGGHILLNYEKYIFKNNTVFIIIPERWFVWMIACCADCLFFASACKYSKTINQSSWKSYWISDYTRETKIMKQIQIFNRWLHSFIKKRSHFILYSLNKRSFIKLKCVYILKTRRLLGISYHMSRARE